MKVLIIPSWYPNKDNAMAGSFFHEQATLLFENGHDIKILFGKLKAVSRLSHLKKKLKGKFSKKGIILNTEYLIQHPVAFSFDVCVADHWGDESKYYGLCHEYRQAFAELISGGWKPDLIHAQSTVDAGIVAAYLSEVFKIPFVIIEHQLFLLNQYSQFKQERIVNALQRAAKVGAVSNHQKRCLLMNNIKCNPIVIWNFVDETKFNFVKKVTGSKFRIMTIAYPSYIKDMETFFKSMKLFTELSDGEDEIIVVGNSLNKHSEKANPFDFEKMANKYGVFSKCTFIPDITRDKVAGLMNSVDVFISTSIAETFGVAVREAMLSGVPVVVTASGGVEDSVNEQTGIKTEIGDAEGIAQSVLKIKTGQVKFEPASLRNLVISQSGRSAFLKTMNSFYFLSNDKRN
ncbi:MAG: glycosyltransferase [Bacteroidota bacterium]|nr:glycosyltransferase [Bacteroidota bacterium]